MWNEKTKPLVASGKLVVIGVVQEQHAERAQLYKQWRQFEFPIAQDAVTSLGLGVVPVPILIDEYGYVMSARPRLKQLEKLLAQTTQPPENPAPVLDPQQVTADWLKANAEDSVAKSCLIGDALLAQRTPQSIAAAIESYQQAVHASESAGDSKSAKRQRATSLFRLGVAYRSQYDLAEAGKQDPSGFANAAQYWTKALNAQPNQYIWRRRIQQYGPRQMKPYPFYDWVEQAQQEVVARGETPVALTVPLTGAETAKPKRKFEVGEAVESPDPEGKITRDSGALISHHATVVPTLVAPGKAVRVHLQFAPSKGEWNNESDPLEVWIDSSTNGVTSRSKLVYPHVAEPATRETRTIEFEYQTNDQLTGEFEIKGYALYYVCDKNDGTCLYRRQDFSIPVRIESGN